MPKIIKAGRGPRFFYLDFCRLRGKKGFTGAETAGVRYDGIIATDIGTNDEKKNDDSDENDEKDHVPKSKPFFRGDDPPEKKGFVLPKNYCARVKTGTGISGSRYSAARMIQTRQSRNVTKEREPPKIRVKAPIIRKIGTTARIAVKTARVPSERVPTGKKASMKV